MNDTNLALLEKNRDILSIRDLATGTIATYTSYLTDYINWVEENLPGRSLSDVTFQPHPLFRIPDQLPQDILSEAHTHAAQHRLSRQSLPDNEQCSAHDGSVSQGCL